MRHTYRGTPARGMVLVICLIMLLLLTLSGLAAIQGSTLQEKMAGNSRDGEQAFLAAESALRNGEAFLTASLASATFTVAGTGGLYDKTAPGATPVDWQANATLWRNGSAISGVSQAPRYLIEKLPDTVNTSKSLAADQPLDSTIIYRVTANASGVTSSSRSVLQTTYRP